MSEPKIVAMGRADFRNLVGGVIEVKVSMLGMREQWIRMHRSTLNKIFKDEGIPIIMVEHTKKGARIHGVAYSLSEAMKG